MRLTALVPTYRRAEDLKRCLTALQDQIRRPDQVVVVVRGEDEMTQELLASHRWDALRIEVIYSSNPGQVEALNTGLRAARGDVIAILDDDTAPWPDWLTRIEQHFQDEPRLGGLGGRDMIRADGFEKPVETSHVGRISWYGRWVGQAHRGSGPAREVDLIKGCNMSFRREAVAGVWFDKRLKGDGAQWFNDAAFTLAVKQKGWQVVYDPAVRVDHFLSERKRGDGREAQSPRDVYGVVYNETLILCEYFSPLRRAIYLGFGVTIGTSRAPGLLQWIRTSLSEGHADREFLAAAIKGRLDGWREYRREPKGPNHVPPNREAVSL